MGLEDYRITTRYSEQDPFSAFYSTAHEIGHSLYERGLNKELFGTPLGEAATAGVRVTVFILGKQNLPFARVSRKLA